jgi:hypothetical protein
MYVTMKESLTARDQEEQLHTHHYKKTSDVVLRPLMMILIKFFLSVNLIWFGRETAASHRCMYVCMYSSPVKTKPEIGVQCYIESMEVLTQTNAQETSIPINFLPPDYFFFPPREKSVPNDDRWPHRTDYTDWLLLLLLRSHSTFKLPKKKQKTREKTVSATETVVGSPFLSFLQTPVCLSPPITYLKANENTKHKKKGSLNTIIFPFLLPLCFFSWLH